MRDALMEKWGNSLLKFALDLPKSTPNFSKYVLRLLSQHFDFHKLLIFPYVYAAIDLEHKSRRDALSNFVTLNIDPGSVKCAAGVILRVSPEEWDPFCNCLESII